MGRERGVEPTELCAAILREVDTANVHLAALRETVSRAIAAAKSLSITEQQRIATLRTELDLAWVNAHIAITRLEFVLGSKAVHARDLLLRSQNSARETFDSLWALITKG